jgi:ketosteroid isomerase-like protein
VSDTETIGNLAQRNVALLQRHLDAINDWDFATMRELLHPDVSLELPFVVEPFPKVTQGFDAVMAFMETVPEFAEAENLHDFSIHALADDPNELIAEYRSDMKLRSGREYSNTYVVRATVRDGKLIRFREHFDAIRLLVAIGGSFTLPTEG